MSYAAAAYHRIPSCHVCLDVTALSSRRWQPYDLRTPSGDGAYPGLLTVRPLVDWGVSRRYRKQLHCVEWSQQACWVDRRHDSCCYLHSEYCSYVSTSRTIWQVQMCRYSPAYRPVGFCLGPTKWSMGTGRVWGCWADTSDSPQVYTRWECIIGLRAFVGRVRARDVVPSARAIRALVKPINERNCTSEAPRSSGCPGSGAYWLGT